MSPYPAGLPVSDRYQPGDLLFHQQSRKVLEERKSAGPTGTAEDLLQMGVTLKESPKTSLSLPLTLKEGRQKDRPLHY